MNPSIKALKGRGWLGFKGAEAEGREERLHAVVGM